jgi:hypothetical protein
MAESSTVNPLTWAAVACAVIAIGIIGWYLLRRPPFDRATKILLFAGLAVCSRSGRR